jgi:hypothetical protein
VNVVNNLPNIAIKLTFRLGPGGDLGDEVAFGLLSQDEWRCGVEGLPQGNIVGLLFATISGRL